MYKSLKIALQQNNINFPKHWDQKLSVEFFTTTDSEDLADELRVTTAECKRWTKEMFPDKPLGASINKYLKSILAEVETKEVYEDPKPERATTGLTFGPR